MITLRVAEIVRAVGGQLVFGDPELEVSAISTDTRALTPGALFIALVGQRHDAHRFVGEAISRGAIGAVVSHDGVVEALLKVNGLMAEREAAKCDPIIVRVGDTLRALQDLASHVRSRCPIPLVAVTGSNGKTTVKEMIASVLSTRYRVHKSQGNFNNHVGVPLTLLGLTQGHEVAVVEMGMNAPGEIRKLCAIARPTMGVVTNVTAAHLELLGSVENVVQAKREMVEWLGENDPVVLNADDPLSRDLARGLSRRYLWHGVRSAADVRAEDISTRPAGSACFTLCIGDEARAVALALAGTYNISNALAAASVGHLLGLGLDDICRGLEAYRGLAMRMELIELNGGARVVNDAYNANPASMTAALHCLAQMARGATTHAVLGDMLELGSEEQTWHQRIGELVACLEFKQLYTVGDRAAVLAEAALRAGMPRENVHVCRTHHEAAQALKGLVRKGDWVLVKGSRAMRMERVVSALLGREHM